MVSTAAAAPDGGQQRAASATRQRRHAARYCSMRSASAAEGGERGGAPHPLVQTSVSATASRQLPPSSRGMPRDKRGGRVFPGEAAGRVEQDLRHLHALQARRRASPQPGHASPRKREGEGAPKRTERSCSPYGRRLSARELAMAVPSAAAPGATRLDVLRPPGLDLHIVLAAQKPLEPKDLVFKAVPRQRQQPAAEPTPACPGVSSKLASRRASDGDSLLVRAQAARMAPVAQVVKSGKDCLQTATCGITTCQRLVGQHTRAPSRGRLLASYFCAL